MNPNNNLKKEYEKVSKDDNEYFSENEIPLSYGWGTRHVQTALISMCALVILIIRAHLAVTIVGMTEHNKNGNNVTDAVTWQMNATDESSVNGTNKSLIDHDRFWNLNRKYSWPSWIQEVVLGAFFVGYAIAMWPVGLIVQRAGGKRPLQASLLVSGLLSIATPYLAAVGGWQAVAVTRAMTGLTQAGTYPGATALIARWVPRSERATFGTCVFTGGTVGTVVALQLGGILAASSWGWPATFYTSGTLCLIAFILFTVFGHRSPAHHPTISKSERNYIIGKVFIGKEKTLSTPWRHLLTSRPVWAGFITQLGTSSVYTFIFTQAPSYLHYILGINVQSSGLLSSLAYVANAVTAMVLGLLSDYCTNRGLISVRIARIISNTIGAVGPALCLIALGYTQRADLAVLALVLATAAYAGTITGWMITIGIYVKNCSKQWLPLKKMYRLCLSLTAVNFIDLTPNFSGAMMATGNTLMNSLAICLPLFVAHIVTDQYNPVQWRIVLFVIATCSILSNFVFYAFMSADIQPWNEPLKEPELKEMETIKLKKPMK